jgi:hypothetical protein
VAQPLSMLILFKNEYCVSGCDFYCTLGNTKSVILGWTIAGGFALDWSHQLVLNPRVSNTTDLKSQIRSEPTPTTGLSTEAVFCIEYCGVIFNRTTSIKYQKN